MTSVSTLDTSQHSNIYFFSWSLLSKSKFSQYVLNVFYQMVNFAWSFFQPRWDVKWRENDIFVTFDHSRAAFFVASQSDLNHMQPCKHDIYVLCSLGIKEIRILWLRELWGVSSVIKGLSQWFGNYGDKTKLNAPQNGIKAMMRTRLCLVWRSATRLPDYYDFESRVCCCVEDKQGEDTTKDHKDF